MGNVSGRVWFWPGAMFAEDCVLRLITLLVGKGATWIDFSLEVLLLLLFRVFGRVYSVRLVVGCFGL